MNGKFAGLDKGFDMEEALELDLELELVLAAEPELRMAVHEVLDHD